VEKEGKKVRIFDKKSPVAAISDKRAGTGVGEEHVQYCGG
jgi:hypothetical protein